MDPELQALLDKQRALDQVPDQVQSPGQIAQSIVAPSASAPASPPATPSAAPDFLSPVPPAAPPAAPQAPSAPPPAAPSAPAPATPAAPGGSPPTQPPVGTDSYTAVPPIPGTGSTPAVAPGPAGAPAAQASTPAPSLLASHSGPTVADMDQQFAQAQYEQNKSIDADDLTRSVVAGFGANRTQLDSLGEGPRPLNDLLASRSAHAAAEKAVDDEAARDQARQDNAPGGANETLARALVKKVMGPDFDTSKISGYMLHDLIKELAPAMTEQKLSNWLDINTQKANTAREAVEQKPGLQEQKNAGAQGVEDTRAKSNEKIAEGHDAAKVEAAKSKPASNDSRGLGVALRYATPVRNVQDQAMNQGLPELKSMAARGISKVDPFDRSAAHLMTTADAIVQELSKLQHGGASDVAVKHLTESRPKDVAPVSVWVDWFKQANEIATGIGRNLNEVSENYNKRSIVPGAENQTHSASPVDTSTPVKEPLSRMPPEGATGTTKDGRKVVVKNGEWVPQ